MSREVYLDEAATTRVAPEVVETMVPYFTEHYGNPSSFYKLGTDALRHLNEARKVVADELGAEPEEIYFTSGGSEGDNWALKGLASYHGKKKKHIITSKIEHHAILHTCEYLEKKGFDITYVDVDDEGFIDLEQLEDSIRDDTLLISVMFANNEIGTIQPIKKIGEIAKKHGVLFHTDAVQAFCVEDIDVDEMNIDLLTLTAHKIHGPKGVGALYIRKGVRIDNLIHGGGQERGKRATTENVPLIMGLAKAVELTQKNRKENNERIAKLRDLLFDEVLERIPHVRVNGPREHRLPNNFNCSFRFIEGESLILSLDAEGIASSSGSACTSGSLDPSHVLLAIGLSPEIAHGSLRLTLHEGITEDDIHYVVDKLEGIVQRLRDMSPLYHEYLKAGGNAE